MSPTIKVISLDVDGTLVTPDFTDAVWYEGIPNLLAARRGISYTEARSFVDSEYHSIGDQRLEWYDITWWFKRFGLEGHKQMMEQFRNRIGLYPEVEGVLNILGERYTLVIGSASTREFLPFTVETIQHHFARIFSSITDYGKVKTPEFYQTLCREMAVKPVEVVHAGDHRQLDYDNASAAGVNAFHIDRSCKIVDGSLPDLRALVNKLEEIEVA
jgi:putative hydrolase of the HAD superfamily